ncbi:MAG: hypothetical protein MZV63_23640 [Marinilabiliales bacterium]|nr:hypothetical protein [Marinilabiliales bacterium]
MTTGGAGLASSWTIQRPVSVSTHCTGGSFLGACARSATTPKTETKHPQTTTRRRLVDSLLTSQRWPNAHLERRTVPQSISMTRPAISVGRAWGGKAGRRPAPRYYVPPGSTPRQG